MSYLQPYIYRPESKTWGIVKVEAPAAAPTDYLAQLAPGSDDHSTRCAICDSEGACRTWVEEMAIDANVPAQWLAEQVINGRINRYTSISEINWQYLPF